MALPLDTSLVDAEQQIQRVEFETETDLLTFYPGSDKIDGINYDDISFSYNPAATYAFTSWSQNLIFGAHYWGIDHNYSAALMFRGVKIPRNSIITAAYLYFKAGNTVGPFSPPIEFWVRANKTTVPSSPFTLEECLGLRLTTAYARWLVAEKHWSGTWYSSVGFSNVIQELVDLDRWDYMHDVLIIVQCLGGAAWTSLVSMDAPGPVGAQLKLKYKRRAS